jgi:hypothetical protein
MAVGLWLLAPSPRVEPSPRVWLWAWERPERLGFIDPAKVGVAFHAATLRLVGDTVRPRSRYASLVLPPGTHRVAVMRIEVERGALLSQAQRQELVRFITGRARMLAPEGVQVDFDARLSERPFYRALLQELRAALPSGLNLSMTALASWCLDDDWLDGLPVDEVVPMVFRMGVDSPMVRGELARHGDFTGERCRRSVGFVTDEPVPALPPGRRVYWFNPRSWSAQDLQPLLEQES